MLNHRSLCCFCVLVATAAAAPAADWEPLTDDLVKTEKPGFGGLCGVVVDHATGAVYVDLSDKGLYRSDDQGKTWKPASTKPLKGRSEWPGCIQFDPTGKSKKLVAALVYGVPISTSGDSGATWTSMNARSEHVDWCAVDWSDPEMKFVLALKHESGGLLIASHDGGRTFADVGKGYGPAWIFDSQTAVVAEARTKDRPKPKLLRTRDGGKTFEPAGDHTAQALPKWRDGALYWLTDDSLLVTADKGQTWTKLGSVKDGRYGPIFGKDVKHLLVLTGAGVVESSDGGATWSKPVPPPKDLKGINPLTWIEYDPTNNVVYLMKMGTPLFRMKRI